jgi:hypothetical protein
VRTITGEELGLQVVIWSAEQPSPRWDRFKLSDNDGPHSIPIKPKGGLWTSTYLDPTRISAWAEWCRENTDWLDVPHTAWLLEPDPKAKLLEIDCFEDLEQMFLRYGHTVPLAEGLDLYRFEWQAIASTYAGIHLTERGQWATRLSHPLNLYGWDCESTVWLQYAFTAVVSHVNLSHSHKENT